MLADPHRLPPGQVLTAKWPVLHYGAVPQYDLERWRLRVLGEVERELEFSYADLLRLPQRELTCDIHCVTTWSRLDASFGGIPMAHLAELAGVRQGAVFLELQCFAGFTTSVPLEFALAEDALLALRHEGKPLVPEHGFPARGLFPRRYFWKSAKWVEGLAFLRRDRLGFWERNGYNNGADPWLEERYW